MWHSNRTTSEIYAFSLPHPQKKRNIIFSSRRLSENPGGRWEASFQLSIPCPSQWGDLAPARNTAKSWKCMPRPHLRLLDLLQAALQWFYQLHINPPLNPYTIRMRVGKRKPSIQNNQRPKPETRDRKPILRLEELMQHPAEDQEPLTKQKKHITHI